MVLVATAPNDAIRLLNTRVDDQQLFWQYWNGMQPLTFTTKKYRDNFARMIAAYTENMCPAVIEPIVDRLKILQLEVDGSDSNDAATQLWTLWKNSLMEAESNDLHNDALVSGNGYLFVWINEKGEATFTPQSSDEVAVHYADETGIVDWGVKNWQQEDGYVRVTLYYPDRIERYVSAEQPSKTNQNWDKLSYRLLNVIRNPYGKVPIFHFANKVRRGMYGLSELKDVIPIQDALNKSVADLLVSMEFNAFAQRWATGIEVDTNELGVPVNTPFRPGIDRVWAVANENAKFGEFGAADLEKFIKVHDAFCLTLARVSGTPLHFMQLSSSVFPSGEALKTAESRFESKVQDKQLRFGAKWEEVFRFAADISGIAVSNNLDIKWSSAAARSERDMAEIGGLKKVFGVSNKMIQRENGYTEAQIAQMAKENEEAMPIATVPDNTDNNQIDSTANQRQLN